jgi:4-amino-4-deoxy-L-arabinose transferase-like glycosyltransferase
MFAVRFPLTEGSAYYVAVARNMAEGRGPVIDAIWSYATPPFNLPGKPAFELWQPMASFIAAAPMPLLGSAYSSAQLAFAVAGALLAPLAWLVARDAARRLDLPSNRQAYVALGAGVLVAFAGPFVISAAVPDSTLPFTLFACAACLCMPAAARGNSRALLALGVLLGFAYLTRMEAIYLGLVFIAVAWVGRVRGRAMLARVGAVALIGGLVVLPWWARNYAAFGTPMPGQLADNAFLTSNEQIFAWTDQPSLSGFLAQGPATILTNIGVAFWHNAFDVLLVPGNIIVVVALLTIASGWRQRAVISGSPLWALLVYGAFAFLVTSIVFPVATQWGTFEHASGPLLIAFAVLAVLGGDAFVARVRQWRNWPRPNAGMAPAALTAVVVAMSALALVIAGAQAQTRERQLAAVVAAVNDTPGFPSDGSTIASDLPIWLSDALDRPVAVLPVEPAPQLAAYLAQFKPSAIVLVDNQRASADTVRSLGCATETTPAANADAPQLTIFVDTRSCP